MLRVSPSRHRTGLLHLRNQFTGGKNYISVMKLVWKNAGRSQGSVRHVAGAGDGELGADRADPDAHAQDVARTPRQDLRHALGQ